MKTDNIFIDLIIPESLGKSLTLEVPKNTSIIDIIKKHNQFDFSKKVLKNSNELHHYILVYVDRDRIYDLNTPIICQCEIEVFVPMPWLGDKIASQLSI